MMTTSRNVFTGGYVTQEVKDKLKEKAERAKISVSLMIFRILARAVGAEAKE